MAYFNIKKQIPGTIPIPESPGYIPPTPPIPPVPEPGSVPVIPRPTYSSETSITLYKVSDDNNVIDKSLNSALTFNIMMKADVDVLNPVIILDSISAADYNYAYIPSFGRYYYITSRTAIPGGLTQISMHVDVLKSYSNEIKSLSAVIKRQQNRGSQYIPDPEYELNSNTNKKTIKFSKSPFTKNLNYLLTVNGGV